MDPSHILDREEVEMDKAEHMREIRNAAQRVCSKIEDIDEARFESELAVIEHHISKLKEDE